MSEGQTESGSDKKKQTRESGWRRVGRPSLLVLLLCGFGSLAVHVPAYSLLGVLADRTDFGGAELSETQTIEFEVAAVDNPDVNRDEANVPELEEPPAPPADTPPPVRPRVRRPRAELPPAPRPVEPRVAERIPEPEPEPVPVPEMEERPSPEVEPEEQQQSITQESPNPPEEAPDDARFLAEQNRVVEEETVARSRSMVRDDEDPQAAAPSAESEPETGNASTEQVAELEDEQGSDERLAMTEQAESAQVAREEQAAVAAVPPSQVQTEGEQGDNETVINDGFGTLRLPSAPSTENRHPSANRASAGVLEQPGWSALEGIVGREALEEEREVHAAQQRSRTRGAAREQRWREFRAAIENFTPTVRPGNQTALNAAASPFAAYLAAVHRRIHRQFAHRFLQGLPTWSTSPFSDSTLMTRLEIVFNQAGTIHEIGVVRSSGFEPFDLGAFNAVMRAQPYPRAPDSILSGDGRVYVHWGFYRSHRQCGTFNARPYIIPHPNGRPVVPQGPIDEPQEPTSPSAAETGNASALLNERPRRRAG